MAEVTNLVTGEIFTNPRVQCPQGATAISPERATELSQTGSVWACDGDGCIAVPDWRTVQPGAGNIYCVSETEISPPLPISVPEPAMWFGLLTVVLVVHLLVYFVKGISE